MQSPRRGSTLLLLCAAYVAYLFRGWTWEENAIHNVLNVISPMHSINPVRGRTVEVQVAHLAKVTRTMEVLLGKAPRLLMRFAAGQDIAAASFGPTATKLVQLEGGSSGGGSNEALHPLPSITCACPRSAGAGDTLPLVLYFHSGGMVVGSVDAELHYARYIAHEASAVVCSVEYRKAPAYQLSDVLDDVMAASVALLEPATGDDGGSESATPTTFSSKTLGADLVRSLGIGGIDTSQVATFGISAGGYLAGMVPRLLAAQDREESSSLNLAASIRVQVSIVPMVRPLAGTPSMVKYFHAAPDWSGDYNTYAWSALLLGDTDGSQAFTWKSNMMVDLPHKESMGALPPVYVVTAIRDVLRDEGRAYAEHLQSAGRLIDHLEYNTNHGGVFPELSRRGPADGALFRAVQVLSSRLRDDLP